MTNKCNEAGMKANRMVFVVIGHQGEWSSLIVWVAGAFTDKSAAVEAVEKMKRDDRSNRVVWNAWNDLFGRYGLGSGATWDRVKCSWDGKDRDEAGVALGIGPEPPLGRPDSEYFVANVPLNTPGEWHWE